jgi:ABC-2 type transport system permease protein
MVIFFSGFRRAKLRRKIGTIIVTLVVLGFAGFLFWLSWTFLGLLRSPIVVQYIDPHLLLESMPSAVVSLATLTILVTNFGVLLQALYLAGDMEFLLSAPLPMRAVFLTKLLQAILPNIGLVMMFSLPVLFGLGASGGYSILYYPLVVFALILLTLAAGGLSSLLVMLVVRVIPARRVAEVLGFVGAIISVVLSQSGRFFANTQISGSQVSSSLNFLTRLNAGWSPFAWVGRGLVDIGTGNWLPGLALLALSLGLAGIVFWLSLTMAERLYYTGWATMQGSPVKRKKPSVQPIPVTAAGPALPQATPRAAPTTVLSLATLGLRMPSSFKALVWKDFVLLRRDLRNLSQLITPLILGVILIFSFSRGGFGEDGGRAAGLDRISPDVTFYLPIAFILMISWSLVLNLSLSAFSREGRQYWVIQAAPIRPVTLLGVKFLVAYMPSVLFQWILLLIFALLQRPAAAILLYGLLVMALCIAGSVGINLAFGVVSARLDWDDPRRMNSGSAGCIGSLVSFLYIGLSAVIFFGLPVLFTIVGWNPTLGQLAGLLLGGTFSLACGIIPLALVHPRVATIGMV